MAMMHSGISSPFMLIQEMWSPYGKGAFQKRLLLENGYWLPLTRETAGKQGLEINEFPY